MSKQNENIVAKQDIKKCINCLCINCEYTFYCFICSACKGKGKITKNCSKFKRMR